MMRWVWLPGEQNKMMRWVWLPGELNKMMRWVWLIGEQNKMMRWVWLPDDRFGSTVPTPRTHKHTWASEVDAVMRYLWVTQPEADTQDGIS